jgi:transcriptional regulator SbtR-like protein
LFRLASRQWRERPGARRRQATGRGARGPAQAGRCPAQREDPARRGRGGLRDLGRRSAGARHRGQGGRRGGHDLPPLPDASRPHRRRHRHQVEACAEAGPALLTSSATPYAALGRWINLFVDFLVTKHGLAAVPQSDDARFGAPHGYFLDRLVPVCAQLLDAAAGAGEIRSDVDAYELIRGTGNLCAGADNDPRYDARRLVGLLIAGLRLPH